jgi:cobalamin synthase
MDVSGYTVMELLIVIVVTYIVVILLTIAHYMRELVNREENEGEKRSRAVWILIGGCIFLTVLYVLPVRVGTVMVVLGMLLAWLFLDLRSVFSRWVPFSVSKEDVARTIVGEKRG